MTIHRELVSEAQARKELAPLACPKCGNTTAGKGLSHWWHVTRTRAVLGMIDGKVVTDTDSEENDFSHTGEPKIQEDGLYCNACHYEWGIPADHIDIDDVVNNLGLKLTIGRMLNNGWQTVAACGGDIRAGDAVVRGTTVYELTRVSERSGDVVRCEYGSPGNGGSFPVGVDEEVRLLRRAPAAVLPADVVNYLTQKDGTVTDRFAVDGLRLELEKRYTPKSVSVFLNRWKGGVKATECWDSLRPKPEETP